METDLVANGIAAMREQVLRRICNVLWQNHGRPHNLGTHLGNHVGQNAARGDEVDANAVFKDLVGKRLGKTAQGMLARNIGALIGITLMGNNGANVDNLRRWRCLKERQRLAHEDERRAHVCCHHGVELFGRYALQRPRLHDARIVHQDIEPASCADVPHKRKDAALVRKVTGDGLGGTRTKGSGLIERGTGPAHQDNVAAKLTQPLGNSPADARARAGNQSSTSLDARFHLDSSRLRLFDNSAECIIGPATFLFISNVKIARNAVEAAKMGLKRRPIKPLAVVWQQHHLDGSPLPQLKQPRWTPELLPGPPRIALSRLCRAPLDKGPSGSPTSTASKKKPTPWGASCRLRRSTESTMYSLNSSVGSFAYLIPKCVIAAPILENPTLAFFLTLSYQLNQHFPIRVSVSK